MGAVFDRVKVLTTTTGTGTLTLGAAFDGFRTFAAANIPTGTTVSYVIENGTSWEVGQGVYSTTGSTLTRTVQSSSNANALVAFTGTSAVYVTVLASDFNELAPKANPTFTGNLTAPSINTNSMNVVPTGNQNAYLQAAPGGTGVYSILQLKGNGSNATLGLDITAGAGGAFYSADTHYFRNGAQSITYLTVGNGLTSVTGNLTATGSLVDIGANLASAAIQLRSSSTKKFVITADDTKIDFQSFTNTPISFQAAGGGAVSFGTIVNFGGGVGDLGDMVSFGGGTTAGGLVYAKSIDGATLQSYGSKPLIINNAGNRVDIRNGLDVAGTLIATGNLTVNGSATFTGLTYYGDLGVGYSAPGVIAAEKKLLLVNSNAPQTVGSLRVLSSGVLQLAAEDHSSGFAQQPIQIRGKPINFEIDYTNRMVISLTGVAVTGVITASGNISGANLSGTNTGDQTTITGNAGSATVLQTARTINGVSFNGSANITINAVDSTARLASSAVSAYGLTLIDDADAATARTTLGLGTLSTQTGTFSGTSSGTNTGDQTLASLGAAATGGANATGTWPINITGNATTANSATSAGSTTVLSYVDNRSVVIAPQDYSNTLKADFKTATVVDSPPVQAGSGFAHILTASGWNGGNAGGGGFNAQISTGDGLAVRQATGLTTWGPWRTMLHNNNFNTYAPTLTGTGASGSWGISITGNAATATSASSVTGFSGTSSGTNTGDQTTITGNAGSATILQTARTINGVSFNGSANITINAVDSTSRLASSAVSAFALTFLDDADAATVRATIGAQVAGSYQPAGTYATGGGTATGTNTGDQNLAPYALLAGASFTGTVNGTNLYLNSTQVVWSPTVQGTAQASLHHQITGASDAGQAITWGASAAYAGIYVVGNGGTGTSMYISTTNSYAAGAQTAISISPMGNVSIPRGTLAVTGNISAANLSGINTGDQTSITGNAGSATVLQTARTINGVSFNGSANISINAVDSTARLASSAVSAFGLTLIDDADAATARATIGAQVAGSYQPAGTYATGTGSASGVNTGDQTLPTRASLGLATTDSVTFRDVYASRGDATGVIFLGNSSARYLFYNGTNYEMPGASLILNGSTISGSHTGNSSGTNTGDQTNISGNAATATVLQTARTINGVSFNGSANITINAVDSTAREAAITAGTTVQFWRGDKSWQTLTLADVPDAWVKRSVRAATTANIALSAAQTIDGIALAVNDRVLVKDQTTPSQNGIYVVQAGAWTRALDADASSELAGAWVVVDTGTSQGGTTWNTDFRSIDTIGTTNNLWARNVDRMTADALYLGITATATAATKLITARTINGVNFDGTAAITINAVDSTARLASSSVSAFALTFLDDADAATVRSTIGAQVAGSYQAAGTYVTSVGATAPIASSGGTAPTISITAATTTVAGSMSAADKTKLDGVAAGATANAGTVTGVSGTAPIVSSGGTAPAISISAATTGAAGSMSAADKTKIDALKVSLVGDATQDSEVTKMMRWKNYGSSHVIFDASAGTSPTGTAVNATNAAVAWSGTYPTLMGWNGSSTYGVRVDSARVADSAGSVSGFSGTSSGTNTGDQTNITGNAGSATVLQTARTINGASFNGSANITINAVDSTARLASSAVSAFALTFLDDADAATVRSTIGAQVAGSYQPAGTYATGGGTATGTNTGDQINISGNAATATNISGWTASANSLGPSRLFRRDSNDNYNLQHHWTGSRWWLRGYLGDTFHAEVEVGYAASAGSVTGFSGTSSGTNTGDQTNISGNAGTATTLQTARLINGTSFNGGSDITISAANPNAVTFNNSNNGAASGSTYTGSGTLTVSANTLGAVPNGSITGGNLGMNGARLLGRETAGYGSIAEITIGSGLTLSGGILSAAGGGGGTVTGVSGTAPIISSGGTAPAISISAATTGAAGSMSAADKIKLDAITGTNTGDQTSITGNAGSATVLQTARTINGVSFNGSANITINAVDSTAREPAFSTLGVAKGGTGVTTSTGSGSVVLSVSPTFTGTPLAPTAALFTASTQLATTAFVDLLRDLPQTTKTSAYTLALVDRGSHISITTGGVVIPANASVAFPIGSTISIYNDSVTAQTISITTDTLRLAGTATVGSRTLAQRGVATLLKVKANEWIVNGNVT